MRCFLLLCIVALAMAHHGNPGEVHAHQENPFKAIRKAISQVSQKLNHGLHAVNKVVTESKKKGKAQVMTTADDLKAAGVTAACADGAGAFVDKAQTCNVTEDSVTSICSCNLGDLSWRIQCTAADRQKLEVEDDDWGSIVMLKTLCGDDNGACFTQFVSLFSSESGEGDEAWEGSKFKCPACFKTIVPRLAAIADLSEEESGGTAAIIQFLTPLVNVLCVEVNGNSCTANLRNFIAVKACDTANSASSCNNTLNCAWSNNACVQANPDVCIGKSKVACEADNDCKWRKGNTCTSASSFLLSGDLFDDGDGANQIGKGALITRNDKWLDKICKENSLGLCIKAQSRIYHDFAMLMNSQQQGSVDEGALAMYRHIISQVCTQNAKGQYCSQLFNDMDALRGDVPEQVAAACGGALLGLLMGQATNGTCTANNCGNLFNLANTKTGCCWVSYFGDVTPGHLQKFHDYVSPCLDNQKPAPCASGRQPHQRVKVGFSGSKFTQQFVNANKPKLEGGIRTDITKTRPTAEVKEITWSFTAGQKFTTLAGAEAQVLVTDATDTSAAVNAIKTTQFTTVTTVYAQENNGATDVQVQTQEDSTYTGYGDPPKSSTPVTGAALGTGPHMLLLGSVLLLAVRMFW